MIFANRPFSGVSSSDISWLSGVTALNCSMVSESTRDSGGTGAPGGSSVIALIKPSSVTGLFSLIASIAAPLNGINSKSSASSPGSERPKALPTLLVANSSANCPIPLAGKVARSASGAIPDRPA